MILVTGGAGFIGSHLVRRLFERGERVAVLDDLSRHSEYPPVGVRTFVADVRDEDDVRQAAYGCDTIFHLAAVNGTKNFYERPWDVLDVGLQGTLNVLRVARQRDLRVVYFSSSEVYQQPTTIPTPETERGIVPDFANPRFSYGGSKIAGELLTINSGVPYQIIRPHNVYGPGMGDGHVVSNLIDKFEAGPVTIQGEGTETRSFCHIDDMIDGVLLAYDKGAWNETYNVGADEEISIRTLAMKIAAAMGKPGSIQTSVAPRGETNRRCPDISKLRALGYQPKVSLDEGLRRLLATQ